MFLFRIRFLSRCPPRGAARAASPPPPPPPRTAPSPTFLARVISRCDPADIARVAAVSLLFYASLAAEGIRLWAQERGFELPAQPEDESCAVRWLCFAALLCESNPPARLATGERHSVFIDGEGRLSSCGKAESWLLGHGNGVMQLNTPTRLLSMLGGERAVSVSAGGWHSLAITTDDAVWSWGWGHFGQLGHGDEQNQLLSKKIEAFAGQRVLAVSAAHAHSLAITAVGALWSWGYGYSGMLSHGDEQNQLLCQRRSRPLRGGARRRCVGWRVPQPRHHRRRQPLEMGRWEPNQQPPHCNLVRLYLKRTEHRGLRNRRGTGATISVTRRGLRVYENERRGGPIFRQSAVSCDVSRAPLSSLRKSLSVTVSLDSLCTLRALSGPLSVSRPRRLGTRGRFYPND